MRKKSEHLPLIVTSHHRREEPGFEESDCLVTSKNLGKLHAQSRSNYDNSCIDDWMRYSSCGYSTCNGIHRSIRINVM